MLLGELEPGMRVVVKRAGRRRPVTSGLAGTFLTYEPETARAVVRLDNGDVLRAYLGRLRRPRLG